MKWSNQMGAFSETPSPDWIAIGSKRELIHPSSGVVVSPAGCHSHTPNWQAREGRGLKADKPTPPLMGFKVELDACFITASSYARAQATPTTLIGHVTHVIGTKLVFCMPSRSHLNFRIDRTSLLFASNMAARPCDLLSFNFQTIFLTGSRSYI